MNWRPNCARASVFGAAVLAVLQWPAPAAAFHVIGFSGTATSINIVTRGVDINITETTTGGGTPHVAANVQWGDAATSLQGWTSTTGLGPKVYKVSASHTYPDIATRLITLTSDSNAPSPLQDTVSIDFSGAKVGVAATKLIVVDKLTASGSAKAVFVAKDPAISKGSGTDTSLIGVTLDFDYDNGVDPPSAGQFLANAGLSNWLVNKSTVAKYVNKDAPAAPGGAKVVVIKPANLAKVVGKNLGDTPIDILNQSGAATGVANTACCIDNDGDAKCYCSTFSTCAWKSIAGATGAKLVCKTGTADATCAALP